MEFAQNLICFGVGLVNWPAGPEFKCILLCKIPGPKIAAFQICFKHRVGSDSLPTDDSTTWPSWRGCCILFSMRTMVCCCPCHRPSLVLALRGGAPAGSFQRCDSWKQLHSVGLLYTWHAQLYASPQRPFSCNSASRTKTVMATRAMRHFRSPDCASHHCSCQYCEMT